MMVLKARGMTRRGSLDSPATIERYSRPPIQYPATLTPLTNDCRRVGAVLPTHGPGFCQYRKPKRSCRGFPPSMTVKVNSMRPMARRILTNATQTEIGREDVSTTRTGTARSRWGIAYIQTRQRDLLDTR